jgi:pyruvate-formate lyase
MKRKIVVVGSFIADLTSFAPKFPRDGETVIGSMLKIGPGGKGSNAATAANRAGGEVVMITKVGRDTLSDIVYNHYKNEGMTDKYIYVSDKKATGAAIIEVNENTGENRIIVMNLLTHNCIEKGCDVTLCAEQYNMCIDGVGLGTIADSFATLQQRITEEKLTDWDEVYQAVKCDFKGLQNERIRLMMTSAHRYCEGGGSAGDKWAKKISLEFARLVKDYPAKNGIKYIPGWFSWSNTIFFGKQVGATPNGRNAFTPVTHGANPTPGFRKDGAATAMINGIAAIQTGYGNTCPVQLELDPRLTVEEGGIEKVMTLIETHSKSGGTLLNINILDREKLMEAHRDPMLHPDLVVRVTGFTAYFAALSPEFRQLVIDRFIDSI